MIVYDPDVPADATDVNQEGKTLPEDAARADFAHWLLVDIPADVTELPEGAGSTEIVVGGKDPGPTEHGVGGVNSYTDFLAGDPDMGGTYGHYDGPFPPFNDERLHHYHFVVHALDVPSLGLEGEFKLDDVARRRSRATCSTRASWSPPTRSTRTCSSGRLSGRGRRRASSELANATRSSTAASTSPRSTISTGECM